MPYINLIVNFQGTTDIIVSDDVLHAMFMCIPQYRPSKAVAMASSCKACRRTLAFDQSQGEGHFARITSLHTSFAKENAS